MDVKRRRGGIENRVESTLKTRLNLLEILDGIAKSNPDGRKFFVAKAAYFYFAAPGSISKDEMEDFSKNGGLSASANMPLGKI